MNEVSARSWWESLRHFGLLLSPDVVNRIGNTHAPPDLPCYRLDQLRRELNRRESGDIDAGRFVAWVLDKLCGFEGREGIWTRGPTVPPAWTQTLVTGEGLKPRHVWTGHRGGALPVFFDNSTMLGQGRGRKSISDCAQWLRKAHRPLALVTNGRQWRLLYAGLDFEAACEWDTELWFEQGEPGPQLEALRMLLQPALLASAAKDQPVPLVTAIQDSRKGQSELSAFMGERVRAAVEALVRAHGPALSTTAQDMDGAGIYRAAVRVVMRLVVILFAETRELLPRSEPTYERSYGLQGLFEALQRVAVRGRTRLSHCFGAWPRALALFRVIHAGADHPDLGVPAYGGELFAPGKPDDADPVNRALAVFESACFNPQLQLMPDVVVYEMLELLMRTQVRVRQGRATTRTVVPVDFAGLSTEYIGVLYEGLLDYELRTAPVDDPVVFLSVGNEPALPLSALEAMEDRQIRQLFEAMKESSSSEGDQEGPEEVVAEEDTEGAGEEDGETSDQEVGPDGEDDLESCEEQAPVAEAARQRALTWARRGALVAGLVRKPKGRQTPEKQLAFEKQLGVKARQLAKRVVQPGEWFLVRWGGTRKGAGTFYTRPQLAVPTVHRTLRPLAYNPPVVDHRPQEAAPPEQWTVRKPEEILELKVCDPSCGSGSFLVAAVRFLTDALYDALHEHDRLEGDWRRPVDELLGLAEAADDAESLQSLRLPVAPEGVDFEPRTRAMLRRYVVERCIYGVDLDPLAVELCRLALWLETMDRELPFSFLDHKVKCGNSLVGAWFDQFRHYPAMAWKNREGGDKTHSNGVHFERNKWGSALREFANGKLKNDLLQALSGQYQLGEPAYQNPTAVHDGMACVLEELHSLPVHDVAEQARRYREDFLGSPAWLSLKAAFDQWCACWFWPADEIDSAPLASNFHQPADDTRVTTNRVASQSRFFHWELEFPDVYRKQDSGFDAVLGNPPWETMQPSSQEFFSNRDPLYRSYGKQEALRRQEDLFRKNKGVELDWLTYNSQFADFSNWMKHVYSPFGDPERTERPQERFSLLRGARNKALHAEWRQKRSRSRGYADDAHPFRHRGEGKAYTYKLFLELAHASMKKGGRLGFVVPSGLYSDHGTRALRELLLDECRWEWLFGFENRDKVFDIHRSFKFNPVIIEKAGRTEAIRTAFMRRRLDDWETAEAHVTSYDRRQVERFSPKSQSILEIQSSRDLEILEKIYANSVLLGDDGPEGWGIQYSQGDFNMTSDSALFPPRPHWEERGYQPDEYSRWLKGEWKARTPTCPAPPGAKRVEIREGIILSRDGNQWIDEERIEDTALPLYEGRMIGQFDYSQKGWVSGKGRRAVWETIDTGDKGLRPQFLMGISEFSNGTPATVHRVGQMCVSSGTNTRTLICTPVPDLPCGHKVATLAVANLQSALCLSMVLNSLAADYQVRMRLAGLEIDQHLLYALAVPKCSAIDDTAAYHTANLAMSGQSFAGAWLELIDKWPWWRSSPWKGSWCLTETEIRSKRAALDAVAAWYFGLDREDLRHILSDCDWPEPPNGNPKGFWRVDKNLTPEIRQTVLTMVAFQDLEEMIEVASSPSEAIRAFLTQNDGAGWVVPGSLCLADYELGHDDRAHHPQPVGEILGPRRLDWQTAQDTEESWKECGLHARNMLGSPRFKALQREVELRNAALSQRDRARSRG